MNSYQFLMDFAFHIISKESFVIQGCKFFPMFSSERVIVLGFMFRFLIYFELTVVIWCNVYILSFSFLCLFNCSSTISWKNLSFFFFLIPCVFTLLSKNVWLYLWVYFWPLSSVSLVYSSVHSSALYCFVHFNFIMSWKQILWVL